MVIRLAGFSWRGVAAASVLAAAGSATAESASGDCNGVDFDARKPIVVSRVTAASARLYYVKSAWEDASCPADTGACRRAAYLMPGDLVLTGRTLGSYTCIAYQSPRDRKQVWTNGWVASAHLAPVPASRASRPADWAGTWSHAGGEITIRQGDKGTLTIEGIQAYPAAQNVHTGVIGAKATPADDILAFADDGTTPFDQAQEGDCQVRMQRLEKLLVVEDNGACGGSMVTFTGFFQRKR